MAAGRRRKALFSLPSKRRWITGSSPVMTTEGDARLCFISSPHVIDRPCCCLRQRASPAYAPYLASSLPPGLAFGEPDDRLQRGSISLVLVGNCCVRCRAIPDLRQMSAEADGSLLSQGRRLKLRNALPSRHCEEHQRRSNPCLAFIAGLLRFARNDGIRFLHTCMITPVLCGAGAPGARLELAPFAPVKIPCPTLS